MWLAWQTKTNPLQQLSTHKFSVLFGWNLVWGANLEKETTEWLLLFYYRSKWPTIIVIFFNPSADTLIFRRGPLLFSDCFPHLSYTSTRLFFPTTSPFTSPFPPCWYLVSSGNSFFFRPLSRKGLLILQVLVITMAEKKKVPNVLFLITEQHFITWFYNQGSLYPYFAPTETPLCKTQIFL